MADDWKQLELAVFATQLYDKHVVGDGRDVFYDVKLPNPDGHLRQVDVAVCDSAGRVLRVFEVQDRAGPLGSDVLGGLIDKLGEISVPFMSTVTRAGYSAPAVDRLARSPQVTALELRPPGADSRLHQLDMVEVVYDLAPEGATPQLAELNAEMSVVSLTSALDGTSVLDVAYGISSRNEWRFTVVVCARRTDWVGMMVMPMDMPHEATPDQAAPVVFHFQDGRSECFPPSQLLEQRRP